MDSIHLPNAITLPTAFGAPGTPLQAGQVVQALVLELIESDVFRLQLPQATVDVRSEVPLAVGSTVTLAVKGAGANARVVIYADDARPAPQTAQPAQAAASTLAGKHPVGEAVVIARAPVQSRAPVDTPVLRDAPPVASARAPQPPQQPQIVTPERALGEAVRAAATKQSGLAPLFADVEQVARVAPETIPAPVRAAAQQVAALRVPLDENLTASDVKQAFVRSGVLFEPRLAAGKMAQVSPPTSLSTAPLPAGDLKAALLVLRQVLKSWVDKTWADDSAPVRASAPPIVPAAPDRVDAPRPAPPLDAAGIKHLANALAGVADEFLPATPPLSPEQAASLAKSVATQLVAREAPDYLSSSAAAPLSNGGPPPPYRGAPLSAQPPVAPTIAPDTPPRESAERLLAATDSAIARTTLLQAASLPDQQTQRIDPTQRWTFEVPFATPQGTAVAQFEVSRDPQGAKSERQLPTWRARFSLDVEPMGPVHALVALAGSRASVTLWAERQATAARLTDNAAMLNDALRAAELEPADVLFRVGAPPNIARQAAPGRFMDRAS